MNRLQRAFGVAFRATLQRNGILSATNELISALVAVVPIALVDPFDEGIFFYHGALDEAAVVDAQYRLMDAHLNLAVSLPFRITLSSISASPFAALAMIAIIEAVRADGRDVHAHAIGAVMNGALAIAQAAKHRTLENTAFVMLRSQGPRQPDTMSTHIEDTFFALYAARSGTSAADYRRRSAGGLAPIRWGLRQRGPFRRGDDVADTSEAHSSAGGRAYGQRDRDLRPRDRFDTSRI